MRRIAAFPPHPLRTRFSQRIVKRPRASASEPPPHIYFSKQPYPREFSNKIQKIPNSDNFIKFRYRADLADYLVEHLPKQKTFQVAYYRECEKREAKKRRRKKRK